MDGAFTALMVCYVSFFFKEVVSTVMRLDDS